MSTNQPSPVQAKVGLARQLAVCAASCTLALLLIYLVQGQSIRAVAMAMPLGIQLLAGLGVGVAATLASFVVYRLSPEGDSTRNTIDSYSRLDLSGLNPVWISLAAAFGEELLFRAALQPLLGIWAASLIFLLAHAPAYRFRSLGRPELIQAAGVFATSIFLGLIFQYIGLVAAMLIHASLDIVGLYTIRQAVRAGAGSANRRVTRPNKSNARTKAALAELDEGGGKQFPDVDAPLADLDEAG
jgi:membrane protease YdiL (CAAX protease family)